MELLCPHLRLQDKICSTMSHVQDESREKMRQAKAVELFVFIESMSQTCMCKDLLCPKEIIWQPRELTWSENRSESACGSSSLVSIGSHIFSLLTTSGFRVSREARLEVEYHVLIAVQFSTIR